MANLLMLSAMTPTAIAASRGSGVANLLTPDPKEVWVDSTSGSAVDIDLDFGATQSIDTVFLGFTNASSSATWRIRGGASYTATTFLATTTLRAPSDLGGPRWHALWAPAAPVSARYLRLTLTGGGGDPPLQAGIVMAGLSFRPAWNFEFGSGRSIVDTGARERLRSGGFARSLGARVPTWRWTLGDLSDAEVTGLWRLAMAAGETGPVLVVEDPDATAGQAERIHYGLLDRVEAWERQMDDRTRWSFGIEEWL